jgi:hypothetical protein
MTAAAWYLAGWLSCATVVGLLIGGAIRRADYCDHKMPPKQPAGVRDPETSLLWNENGRFDTWA